jgi:cyanophycin synthetase
LKTQEHAVKIKKIRTIAGPNLFHRLPVLIMTLDLEDLADVSSAEIPGFIDRLLVALPGLQEHRCSKGYADGFVERLQTGTYFAHIIEHLALELSTPAGIEVGYGKSVYAGRHGLYDVVVRYRDEEAMRFLLRTAVELASAVLAGKPYPLEEKVAEARRIADGLRFGPSTQAIVDAAEKRGIPWTRLSEQSLVEFGYGVHRKRIQATTSSETGNIAVDVAQDKNLTKKLLERALIPVPAGSVVTTLDEALEAFREIDGKVAIKPLDGNHGRGVSLNLTTEADVAEAFEIARGHSREVIVEECLHGRDYRVVVVGGKMIAAAERVPAHVTGDGVNSIRRLIEIENENPLRGEGHTKPLTKITVDDAAEAFLRRANIHLETVPMAGERVVLRETANLSTGGSAIDVTDRVHPQMRSICERAASQIGLDICGIDLITEDIGKGLSEQKAAIIEVNAGPGIRMHHYPSEGQSRDVAGAIIDRLFPDGSNGRIPIVSVTGTNGKTTVTRMIAHLFHQKKIAVGMTTSDGIYLGKERIYEGDTTGPQSARVVLSDPSVEVAVLETARGGIVRRGLGYDVSDVAVLTNIQADHIGQDGIETVDDILKIKSLVAETVRPGGTLVLNADDPRTLGVRELPRLNASDKNIVLFSLDPENPALVAHIEKGRTGYYIHEWRIYESQSWSTSFVVEAARIPATFGGLANYQIANVMAAIAAARAQGLTLQEVRAGIETFHPTLDNAGRANAYRVKSGYVFVDYGHNPEALRAVAQMARQLARGRITGIISAPGDRSDEMIRLSGQAAAEGFDRVIVREDLDLRGRLAGETARLLCEEVSRRNPNCRCSTELDQKAAFRNAIADMENGEVIFFFYDQIETVREVLDECGARPISNPAEFSAISNDNYLQVC